MQIFVYQTPELAHTGLIRSTMRLEMNHSTNIIASYYSIKSSSLINYYFAREIN